MADAVLSEAVRKRRAADALNGQDDDSEEEDTPPAEQSTEADTGAALAEEEAIDQGAIDQGEVPPAAAEKAPSLGYRFVPITPPDTTVAAPEPEYVGIGEPAPDTLPQVERGELVKPPPETPSQLPQVERGELVKPPVEPAPDTLTQVERGELVKPPSEAPSALPQVERGELVKVPPGTAPQAVAIGQPSAVKPTEPVTQGDVRLPAPGEPAAVQMPVRKGVPGQEAVQMPVRIEPVGPPAVKPGEPAVPPVPTAEYTDRVQKWQAAMRAYGFDAKVKPDGTWTGVDAQGKEVTPEQNKGLYQFGARLSQQYGFSGQEQKLGQLGDAAPTTPAAKRAEAIGAPPKVQPAQPVTTNPDGSDLPQRVQAVGNNDPAAFIVHHTSGRGTVDGVISTLKERGLGVQYVMDRDGNIFQTGGPGAQNILKGWGKGEGLSNQNIVGMEIIAKDDKDVTDAQKQSFARFIAARYPNTPLYGHGEVNPGHKEADEGLSAKTAALAYRDQLSQGGAPAQVAGQPGVAPQAQPVTKQANGLYQNERPNEFLTGKATTFATREDIASGQDNGVGAPRLGRLDTTSVAGVAIPEEALRAKYGNNYAAWRRARVDVVDPQTGKRLRVPIVDLGPRGDLEAIADMTPTLSSYFGGDKNLMVKLVDNAGPDAIKNPQLFADEQAAIRQGFDSSTLQPGVQKIQPKLGYSFKPVDSARNTALQQGFEQASRAAIAQLPEQNQSLPALINRLNQPIKGVPDAMRQNYQKAVKDEATKYAQDYYGIKDPKEALAKIMSSPDAGTFFGEIKDKALPYLNQAVTAFNQSAVTIDQNRLDMLAKALHPEATIEGRKAFISSITSIPDEAVRASTINQLIGTLDPNNPALAALNPVDIADSASRMANPEYQKRQQQEIARQVESNTKALRPDPRLQGTAAGWWADQFAQLPKNAIEALSGPIGQSLMLSEIYQGTVARLRQENPGMSEDELKARAAGSTMAQIVPAEVLNRLAGGKLSGLTGAIENPVQRIGLSALAHVGIGAPAGAVQQIGINVAEGRPITEGVLQAAGAGAVQALPGVVGAVVHGRAPVAEERPQVGGERPPVAEEPPPSVTEPVRPPVEPVRPAEEAAPLPTEQPAAPVTQEDVARRAYELYDERTKNGQPGTAADDYAQAQKELSRTSEPILPGTMSEAEPINSAIANRYVQQRIATGELGQIDPSHGQSTEDMMQQGLQMSRTQRDGLIDNFMKGKGGDLDQQGAAIRAKEALFSEQARAASRAADADPTNPQLQAQAKAAADAVTAFHNGPIKKFKQVWSDSGRALQREIPLDYTTFNGMKEAYLKGNNKEAPAGLEPKLKQMADTVSKTTDAERVAMNNLGKEIENQTRRKTLPSDDQIRARLMEIMKDLPCPT
jgi:N-acetylmuramoyl-L-alanine amidase